MIDNCFSEPLNRKAARPGAYVLYWMQEAQRASANPALALAIAEANARRLPVIAVFALMDDYPEANARHYAFMLQGLADATGGLAGRGVRLIVRRGAPDVVIPHLATRAALVVTEIGHLRPQRLWRARIADAIDCAMIAVESAVVVPVHRASGKSEIGARTLRPKIMRLLDDHLAAPDETAATVAGDRLALASDIDVADPARALAQLAVDPSVPPVRRFRGGETEARHRLERFVATGLADYIERRAEPADDGSSGLSPYLHFGHIAPAAIVRAVRAADTPETARAAVIEQLVVRRELSFNLVAFTPGYDTYAAMPAWSRASLAAHAGDARLRLAAERLEAADTPDPLWNAAMREMVHTGFLHNTMRMYWGKKILEWSADPETAFATALRLNNRYLLDGRDPNSYAGVGWCFGLHDRPWPSRPIFGTVRSMTAGGLERKFDMDGYVRRVAALVEAERGA